MCNTLHAGYKKIPNRGKGFKIFTVGEDGLYPMFHWLDKPYKAYVAIEWREDAEFEEGDGFCFFLDREEAYRCIMDCVIDTYDDDCDLDRAISWVILPIEYSGGKGKCIERKITEGKKYNIAIATSFRIII